MHGGVFSGLSLNVCHCHIDTPSALTQSARHWHKDYTDLMTSTGRRPHWSRLDWSLQVRGHPINSQQPWLWWLWWMNTLVEKSVNISGGFSILSFSLFSLSRFASLAWMDDDVKKKKKKIGLNSNLHEHSRSRVTILQCMMFHHLT